MPRRNVNARERRRQPGTKVLWAQIVEPKNPTTLDLLLKLLPGQVGPARG